MSELVRSTCAVVICTAKIYLRLNFDLLLNALRPILPSLRNLFSGSKSTNSLALASAFFCFLDMPPLPL